MRQTTIGHVPSVFRASREFPKGARSRDRGPSQGTGSAGSWASAGTQAQRAGGRNLIPAFGNSSSVSSQQSRSDS